MAPPIVIGAPPKRHEPGPIELGLMLSRLTEAPIDVVGTFWFDSTPNHTASEEHRRTLNDEVQRALEHSLGEAGRASGEVRIDVICGSPAYGLLDVASRVGAGLIVVGSTHRGTLGRIALGSTTNRVLKAAPCPVAVAPRGFRGDGAAPERIGVAFVDTPGGWAALRAGAAMARRTGAILIAYTVVEPHTHTEDRHRAEGTVERAIAECGHDVRAEARVLTDDGVDALVDESHELDFLLRGSRTLGPLRPPLAFGFVSKLARQVACPFVVVPPGLEDRLVALFDAGVGAERQKLVSS